MPKKKEIASNSEDHSGTIALLKEAHHRQESEMGLTKDGRRRWKRRPKGLTRIDKVELAAVLRAQGKPWAEISQLTCVPEETVSNWAQLRSFQAVYTQALSAFKDKMRGELRGMVPIALTALRELAEGARSEHVRYEAAQAILNQAGDILGEEVVREEVNSQEELIEQLLKKARAAPSVQVNVGVALGRELDRHGSKLASIPAEMRVLDAVAEPAGAEG